MKCGEVVQRSHRIKVQRFKKCRGYCQKFNQTQQSEAVEIILRRHFGITLWKALKG